MLHKLLSLASLLILASCSVASAADAGFSFDDHPGEHLDVLLDGKIVARYMDAHDISTKERHLETYKPYLHVFDAEGKEPITKGPGGEFTHHRGIFIGWNEITYEGVKFDRWHMVPGKYPGDIVHQKFENEKADADSATFTSITHWDGKTASEAMIVEQRTMTFHRGPAPARITIDFTSKLTPGGDIELNGNTVEHAGVHYRPSDDVDRTKTTYTYPGENPNPHKDKDFPWIGETYTLKNGKTYSVVEMQHPSDPKGEVWSAYRDYGRMGAFPVAKIKAGDSLTLKYRFLIADGEMPPADVIEKSYDEYTGTTTAVPKVTVKPAEQPAPAKPKTPAEPKK